MYFQFSCILVMRRKVLPVGCPWFFLWAGKCDVLRGWDWMSSGEMACLFGR